MSQNVRMTAIPRRLLALPKRDVALRAASRRVRGCTSHDKGRGARAGLRIAVRLDVPAVLLVRGVAPPIRNLRPPA